MEPKHEAAAWLPHAPVFVQGEILRNRVFLHSTKTYIHLVVSHLVHFELQQEGKALRVCIKAPEKLNLNAFVCRYNVGKDGEQWHSSGQLLPVFKRICHEDSGSCCLVSNWFSKKISIF